MATFKVGQRVKRVAVIVELAHLGATGTVVDDDGSEFVGVQWDHLKPHPDYGHAGGGGWCRHTLAPLTDPAADAFVSRIKNLKPYEEPVAPKSKVRA